MNFLRYFIDFIDLSITTGVFKNLKVIKTIFITKQYWQKYGLVRKRTQRQRVPVVPGSTGLHDLRDHPPDKELHWHQRGQSPSRVTIRAGVKGEKVAAVRVALKIRRFSYQGKLTDWGGHDNWEVAEEGAWVWGVLHADSVPVCLECNDRYNLLISHYHVLCERFLFPCLQPMETAQVLCRA